MEDGGEGVADLSPAKREPASGGEEQDATLLHREDGSGVP